MATIGPRFRGARQVALFDGGTHSTPVGTTKNVGTPSDTPVGRRVRLHDQASGRLVRETWSNPVTGEYQFQNIRAGTFFVIAFDHTGLYGSESESDIVVPEPAP